MAVCDAEALLASASENGFTKLSTGDAMSVLVTLAQDWEGGSDSAATLLAAAALNEYLFLSNGSIWDCLCQKACDIANP
jgi:hypothetical protein